MNALKQNPTFFLNNCKKNYIFKYPQRIAICHKKCAPILLIPFKRTKPVEKSFLGTITFFSSPVALFFKPPFSILLLLSLQSCRHPFCKENKIPTFRLPPFHFTSSNQQKKGNDFFSSLLILIKSCRSISSSSPFTLYMLFK